MLPSEFYKDLAASALDTAKIAMQAIEYQLPASVVARLEQKKKHAMDPFDDVKFWYLTQPLGTQSPVVVRLLDDLVCLSHAVAQLRNVIAEAPQDDPGTLNLQLAQCRRTP